jgi:hypothetical protein
MLPKQPSTYYDGDTQQIVAVSFSELPLYFQSKGATVFQEVTDFGDLPIVPYKIFYIDFITPITSFFYVDGTMPQNKVYGIQLSAFNPDYQTLTNYITPASICDTPHVTYVLVETATCAVPDVTYVLVEDASAAYTVSSAGGWTVDGTVSGVTVAPGGSTCTLTFKTTLIGTVVDPVGAVVASMPVAAAPYFSKTVDLGGGASLLLGSDGIISYSGHPTSTTGGNTMIQLINVIYTR